jgi:hypothetical protein
MGKFKSRLTSALTYTGVSFNSLVEETSVDGDTTSQSKMTKGKMAMSPTLKYKSTILTKGKKNRK